MTNLRCPATTTLYPRSTYDPWRVESSPTIFQPVEKIIPLTTTSQSGPDQSPLYFRPTYALPDQGPLIADLSVFPERERAGVNRVSGVNVKGFTFQVLLYFIWRRIMDEGSIPE